MHACDGECGDDVSSVKGECSLLSIASDHIIPSLGEFVKDLNS